MEDLYDNRDMTGIAEAIRGGEVSPREVVEFAIRRLEERNPTVNAVVSTRLEQALDEVDAGLPDGPLAGVPYLIKDLYADVAGLPTTQGSRLFADAVATSDSELVARYRRAGMVILGKTNTPEFGQNASTEPKLFGPTRNPYRLTHSPGGSSGGASAAVAAGITPAAHGSDGGGSIRIPASTTGLVGLKPSRGRMPSASPMSGPVSVEHALTRSVRDTALLLDLTHGAAPGAAFAIAPPGRRYVDEVGADPGRLRIAVSTTTFAGEPVHPDSAAVANSVAAMLADLGHHVEEGAPAVPLDALSAASLTLMAAPMAARVDQRLAELGRELREDDLEALPRLQYLRCHDKPMTDLVLGYQGLERTGREVATFFEDVDVFLTPTLAAPTPPLGLLDTANPDAIYRYAALYGALTGVFNVTGQPAISVPLGTDSTGMPLGAQLVGRFGREDMLLRVASQLEAAHPWPLAPHWPPTGS